MKKKLLYFGIAIIPALLCLVFICYFGTNVLYWWDEWTMVQLTEKVNDSGLNFTDLSALHNEHRIFFPRLLYLAVVYLSNFSSIAQMLVSFGMLSLITVVLVNYIIQRDITESKKYFHIALVSFFIYSLTQWENLLWGFQIGFYMVLLFPVLSLYLLSLMLQTKQINRKKYYFIAALLAALIASFSSIQGLLVWITGAILMLFILKKKFFTSPYCIIWVIIAISTWITYFHNYTSLGAHLEYSYNHPLNLLKYFFSLIGDVTSVNEFLLTPIIGVFITAFLVIACIIIWRRRQIPQFIFPLALILNSLFICGSIAIGRVGTARPSRYTSYAIFIIIGLILIWMELKDKNQSRTIIKKLNKVLMIMLVISIPLAIWKGFWIGEQVKRDRAYRVYVLETIDIPLDNDSLFSHNEYQSVERLQKSVSFLKEHKYNLFHKPRYNIPEIMYDDNLGKINYDLLQLFPNTLYLTSDYLRVVQPIVTPDYYDQITSLYLDIDGQIFPLFYDKKKGRNQKVNSIFQSFLLVDQPLDPEMKQDANASYDSAIALRSLSQGMHRARIKALAKDGSYYIASGDMIFEF